MSDMTPELAYAELQSGFQTRTPEYILDRAIRALATIAGMTTEADYRIVNPDTNGGKYEMRRHERYVTEWTPT